MTTIDVSTHEARQAILGNLDALRKATTAHDKDSKLLWLDDKWLLDHGETTLEAAFARIDELERERQEATRLAEELPEAPTQ